MRRRRVCAVSALARTLTQVYNRHLAHVMRHSDASAARHVWKAPGGEYDLDFLIQDYLRHLRHHLDQILAG